MRRPITLSLAGTSLHGLSGRHRRRESPGAVRWAGFRSESANAGRQRGKTPMVTTDKSRRTESVQVRDDLVEILARDLVGAEPTEVLSVAPSRWCLTGFLVPLQAPIEVRQDPDPEDGLGNMCSRILRAIALSVIAASRPIRPPHCAQRRTSIAHVRRVSFARLTRLSRALRLPLKGLARGPHQTPPRPVRSAFPSHQTVRPPLGPPFARGSMLTIDVRPPRCGRIGGRWRRLQTPRKMLQ